MADQRRTLTGKLLRFSTAAVDLFFCFIATVGLITIVAVFALNGAAITSDRHLIVLLAICGFNTILAIAMIFHRFWQMRRRSAERQSTSAEID